MIAASVAQFIISGQRVHAANLFKKAGRRKQRFLATCVETQCCTREKAIILIHSRSS